MGNARPKSKVDRSPELARTADLHLQVRPGEDPTLLAGMVRVIIEEDLYDHAFVAAHVDGLEVLRATVADFTPDYVAARTGVPGAEASMIRLFFSELVQRIDLLAMDMQGAPAVDAPASRWTELYLAGLSQTIGGGTKDIQRNIIGDRFLGLPR